MKQKISILLLVILIITIMSGCGSSGEKLYVFNWGEYIDPDVLALFTEETGIKVVYEEYDTNESMYPKVQNATVAYDVVFPSDYMIERMIEEDLLLKLNFDNIPNYQYINDDFKNLAFDPNNEYSIPYMWGTLGILYNTSKVDEEVNSWSILWDEKYANNILMTDSVRDAFAIPLKILGYSLNTTNEQELEEAKQLLIEQKPLLQAYVVDQVKDKMIGDEAALAVIWSGEAIYTQEENPNLEYVVPKEGSNAWFDSVVIPKTSKNQEAAEKFINFLCRPDIALMNTEFIGYSTPNKEAFLQLDEDLQNDPTAYPTQDILERCEVFVDVDETARNLYNQKWTEVKTAR
jgi:spermidine/putrescine transport system substrate-binding protein